MMSAKAPVELVVLKADESAFKTKAEVVKVDDSAENNSTVFTVLDELSSAKEEVEIILIHLHLNYLKLPLIRLMKKTPKMKSWQCKATN